MALLRQHRFRPSPIRLETASCDSNSPTQALEISIWAIPASPAVTEGILVRLFASGY